MISSDHSKDPLLFGTVKEKSQGPEGSRDDATALYRRRRRRRPAPQ